MILIVAGGRLIGLWARELCSPPVIVAANLRNVNKAKREGRNKEDINITFSTDRKFLKFPLFYGTSTKNKNALVKHRSRCLSVFPSPISTPFGISLSISPPFSVSLRQFDYHTLSVNDKMAGREYQNFRDEMKLSPEEMRALAEETVATKRGSYRQGRELKRKIPGPPVNSEPLVKRRPSANPELPGNPESPVDTELSATLILPEPAQNQNRAISYAL